MDQKLQEVIEKSSFEVINGKWVYAKVKTAPSVDEHFLVSKDKDEITVVTKEENINKLDLIERNKETYKLVTLNVSIPFYSVGFLATVSNAIAEKGINLLIVSTYSKDYILVREETISEVKEVLIDLGFKT
jgi:hypothetical protein